MSKVEFPKPTESAKKVEEYLSWMYEDTIKEVAQSIFIELLKSSKEVVSDPNRFEGVDIRDVVRIFEKYGITEVGF